VVRLRSVVQDGWRLCNRQELAMEDSGGHEDVVGLYLEWLLPRTLLGQLARQYIMLRGFGRWRRLSGRAERGGNDLMESCDDSSSPPVQGRTFH